MTDARPEHGAIGEAALLRKRVERERAAREEAERLLEEKSLELYQRNRDLQDAIEERVRAEKEAAVLKVHAEHAATLRLANDKLRAQIAETKVALERLTNAQEQLVQSEKLASLGALVAGIAHEINTPVGVSVTAASTLEAGARELKRRYETESLRHSDLEHFVALADESARIILRNLERAASLIHSFKQVAVDQTCGEQRAFDLRAYIDDVLASLGPRLRHSGHVVEVESPDQIPVETNPGALAQILTNLVSNSLFHAYAVGQQGRIRIRVRLDDASVVLNFGDDGCGIPSKHLSQIYDPFFTTKRGSGGSGLGLHLVYNLVTKALGGTIEVQSNPGQGTGFMIRFPAIRRVD